MDAWHDPAAAATWDAAADGSPARGRQLELLLEVLTAAAPNRILEVGVGSGLVAERVLDLLPETQLVGVDYSPAMLELARGRLERFGARAELIAADLRAPEAIQLPAAPIDAAYSVQALHHLPDEAKAGVCRWLGKTLPPSALFLLRDKVTVEPLLFGAFAAIWRATGTTMPSTARDYEESLRRKGDAPATLSSHLGWLDAAGFDLGLLDAEGHYVLLAAVRR